MAPGGDSLVLDTNPPPLPPTVCRTPPWGTGGVWEGPGRGGCSNIGEGGGVQVLGHHMLDVVWTDPQLILQVTVGRTEGHRV